MRTSIAAALLLLAVAPALAAQQDPPAAPAPLPSIELPAEIDRVLRDYERGWRAHDAAGLAALFAEDGMVLSSGRHPVRGRAAIEQAYAGAGGPLHLRAVAYEREGPLAYVVGGFSGAEGSPDGGKFILLLRLGADGTWRIVADMDNANQMPRRPPAPPAAP
jgi:ketosteroid isomerase-like protein